MQIKIALAGNPNSGKTTLFNTLTGSNQYVGNWPGVTVEKKEGKLKTDKDVIITDLPGIYSLSPYTLEEVVASRAGRHPADPGWYDRIAKYENLLPQALPAFAAALEEQLKKDFDRYCAQCDEVLDLLPAMTAKAPDVPIVCGEGVTYIASKALLWEENSDLYWRLIERTLIAYRERGIRGTVIRTCMGPEDPAWTLCPDRILHYCNLFLAD